VLAHPPCGRLDALGAGLLVAHLGRRNSAVSVSRGLKRSFRRPTGGFSGRRPQRVVWN
jgi:hypothetical protein